MSGTSEILQEYLVSVGFQSDAVSLRKFEEGLTGVSKKVIGTGLKIAGVVGSVEAATAAFAYNMRKAFFNAELSGTTLRNLKTFEFAGKQIGISAEQMDAAVHSLATTLRLNPGKMALLDSLTGLKEEGKDATQQLLDLIKATEKMPEYLGARYAEQFGIDSDTYHMLRTHLHKFIEEQKKAQDVFQQYGINFKDMKKVTMDYTESLDTLKLKFEALATVIMTKFEPAFKKSMVLLGKILQVTNVSKGAELIKKGDWWNASFVLPAGDLAQAAVWKSEGKSNSEIAALLQHPQSQGKTAKERASQTGFLLPGEPGYKGPTKGFATPVPPHAATTAPAARTGPRNLRNNNPGNIRYGKFAIAHGATGADADGFAIFPNLTTGFAASQDLLQRYGKHGLNTVGGVVSRWAPSSENDTAAYIKSVKDQMHVGANQPLNMSDPNTIVRLSQAMARQEGLPSRYLGQADSTRLGQSARVQNINIKQENNYSVTGGDAESTARAVQKQNICTNSDLVRNLRGALS